MRGVLLIEREMAVIVVKVSMQSAP